MNNNIKNYILNKIEESCSNKESEKNSETEEEQEMENDKESKDIKTRKETKINIQYRNNNIENKKLKKEIIKEKIEKGEDLNIDDMTDENKEYKGNILVNETTYNNKILEDYEEYILYDNKIYKKNKKQTKYYKDKNINLEIFKCNNARKNERVRKAAKLGEFCSARIKKIIKILYMK